MVLGDATAHVEISIAEVHPAVPGVCAGGDVRLRVRARQGDFSGAVDAWIGTDQWKAFMDGLMALERQRAGQAALESVSPGELRLEWRSLDRAGHMGLSGEMTQHVYNAWGELETLRLRFGTIEFDPTLLPDLIRALTPLAR
jgi:hypothetical protein